MKKDYFNGICILILSACILGGAWIISNSISINESEAQEMEAKQITERKLLDGFELMNYLGITNQELNALKGEPTMPIIEINGKYYYPKTGIDRWLTEVNRVRVIHD